MVNVLQNRLLLEFLRCRRLFQGRQVEPGGPGRQRAAAQDGRLGGPAARGVPHQPGALLPRECHLCASGEQPPCSLQVPTTLRYL